MATGGAESAAQARKPGAGGIERRCRERIANVGWLWRRQAHAVVHGPNTQAASRRKKNSGSASRRSCRSKSSAAPGSATPAPPLYAEAMGIKPEAFLAGFGAPMPPREFGEKVVSVLEDPKYADGCVPRTH